MIKIAVIEDDFVIREELIVILKSNNYAVYCITNFNNVISDIENNSPDLVLLDVNLPNTNGYEICKKIKSNYNIPILFVTSRNSDMDEFYGLTIGGDDYITKPYNIPILLARINNLLKKSINNEQKLSVNNVTLDLNIATLIYDNKSVDLTKNEFKIIFYLMKNNGRLVSSSEIIDYLWDNKLYIDENILNVNLTRIRKKLNEIGLNEFIKTKRKLGYIV